MNAKAILISLLALQSPVLLAQEHEKCPADLVRYWKGAVERMGSADVVPRFLINNQCLQVQGSTEFPQLTVQRLDNPEHAELVDQMYAQLNWRPAVKH